MSKSPDLAKTRPKTELGAPFSSAKVSPKRVPDGAVEGTVAVTEDARRRMIETAAYFLAEGRRFAPGYELADWLDAEAFIDAQLSGEEPAALH